MSAKIIVSKRFVSSSNINLNSKSYGFDINNIWNQINAKKYADKSKKSKAIKKVISNYRRSTHPTSVPLNKLFSNSFPLSIKESLDDYASRHNPLKFQHDLLSLLPFFPHPDALGRSSEVIHTPIDDSGNFINEFVVYPPGKTQADTAKMNHIILVHGYGGGLGFFLKNFDGLSTMDNWCIHAVDLLGYGCSSRPPFKLAEDTLEEVENWFHKSYKTWITRRGLDKLSPESKTLVVGHSMGAYLMATYGIKVNPKFCDHLLMLSPGAIIRHRNPVAVPRYFAALWEQNISPFSLVRKLGPLGSKIVSGWSSRRFAHLTPQEASLLHKYAYGIFSAPGSGEYMLNYLLAPGADARHPLIERGIHKLDCKVSWWYGKEDWMDSKGGQLCSNIINNYHKDPTRSSVYEFDNSGHHIYIDSIDKFHSLMYNEMKSLEQGPIETSS
ncbi:Alpha/Beta hydrolase protein [Scheffersomyces amazonensis]|uniref:Alpha/Beta hydrolase protein n=1 Tax=Scheffersomyces amazonensis TaxID=1078765 RepID=UPI00315C7D92